MRWHRSDVPVSDRIRTGHRLDGAHPGPSQRRVVVRGIEERELVDIHVHLENRCVLRLPGPPLGVRHRARARTTEGSARGPGRGTRTSPRVAGTWDSAAGSSSVATSGAARGCNGIRTAPPTSSPGSARHATPAEAGSHGRRTSLAASSTTDAASGLRLSTPPSRILPSVAPARTNAGPGPMAYTRSRCASSGHPPKWRVTGVAVDPNPVVLRARRRAQARPNVTLCENRARNVDVRRPGRQQTS